MCSREQLGKRSREQIASKSGRNFSRAAREKISLNLKSEQIETKVRRFGFSRRVKVYDFFLDLNKYIASTCFTTHSLEKRVSGSISIYVSKPIFWNVRVGPTFLSKTGQYRTVESRLGCEKFCLVQKRHKKIFRTFQLPSRYLASPTLYLN